MQAGVDNTHTYIYIYIYIYIYKSCEINVKVDYVLWHINHCKLLMPNPFYTYNQFYFTQFTLIYRNTSISNDSVKHKYTGSMSKTVLLKKNAA